MGKKTLLIIGYAMYSTWILGWIIGQFFVIICTAIRKNVYNLEFRTLILPLPDGTC